MAATPSGFSGGHFHNGWGNYDQRKLVLNATRLVLRQSGSRSAVPVLALQNHFPEDSRRISTESGFPPPKATRPK